MIKHHFKTHTEFEFSVEEITQLIQKGENDSEAGYFGTDSEVSGVYTDYVRQVLRGQQDAIASIGEDVFHPQHPAIVYSLREYLVIS